MSCCARIWVSYCLTYVLIGGEDHPNQSWIHREQPARGPPELQWPVMTNPGLQPGKHGHVAVAVGGARGVGGGWCWNTGTWGGDGVCMLGAGPGAAVIPGWRDRDGTVTGGAGTGGAGTGGGLATGGAAACAVMADSIASMRADMDEMTATDVCKVLPTLLASLMELLIVVLEPADESVVVVIVGARQHTEVVATVVVAMPWLVLPGISKTFSTGEDIVTLHVVMLWTWHLSPVGLTWRSPHCEQKRLDSWGCFIKQIKYQSRIRKFPCNRTRRQPPRHCQHNARESGLVYWEPNSPRLLVIGRGQRYPVTNLD